jgi:hypothetical protein
LRLVGLLKQGTSRTCPDVRDESAVRSKADIARHPY